MSLIFKRRSGHASERKDVTVKLGVSWTHKLTISFYRTPWANYDRAYVGFRDIIIPACNAFSAIFKGFEYAGYFELRWEDSQCDVYYREKASPLTGVELKALLGVIIGLLIAAGIFVAALTWFKRETRLLKESMKKAEMLEKGLITSEQYDELVKVQKEEPPAWEKPVMYGLIALVVIGGLLVLPRVIPERKPRPPEYY